MLYTVGGTSLLFLTLFGAWSLHVFNNQNGFFDSISKLQAQKLLPDGRSTYTTFTGVASVDEILSLLLTFFWPTVDGQHPDVSLTSMIFAGQAVPAWTLTMLEGIRRGNSWKIISFTTIYGTLVQTLGFALVGPAYLLLHLLTANTVSTASKTTLEIPESALRALPYSLGLGFVLPTVVMALPSPTYLTYENKIYAILIWQAFPIWTQLIQFLLQNTIFAVSSQPSTSSQTQLRLLRRTYLFALYFAVQTHVACRAISLSTLLFPGLFSETAQKQLAPQHVFLPPSPFSDVKVSSIGEGSLWFLQWDYIISGVAYTVWGLVLKYSETTKARSWKVSEVFHDLFFRPNLLGFFGAALTYVWERDEAVLGGTGVGSDKKGQ